MLAVRVDLKCEVWGRGGGWLLTSDCSLGVLRLRRSSAYLGRRAGPAKWVAGRAAELMERVSLETGAVILVILGVLVL